MWNQSSQAVLKIAGYMLNLCFTSVPNDVKVLPSRVLSHIQWTKWVWNLSRSSLSLQCITSLHSSSSKTKHHPKSGLNSKSWPVKLGAFKPLKPSSMVPLVWTHPISTLDLVISHLVCIYNILYIYIYHHDLTERPIQAPIGQPWDDSPPMLIIPGWGVTPRHIGHTKIVRNIEFRSNH